MEIRPNTWTANRWIIGNRSEIHEKSFATYEELCKLLVEIEESLNGRPLCALSDDPLNPNYLCPGLF